MKVIIMRGVSGAGKSTYIGKNFPDAVVCSADHFYIDSEGRYNWDAKKIDLAHSSCKVKFRTSIENKTPTIIVDNTNTKIWELSYYADYAKNNGYEVEVVRLSPNWVDAAARNVHNVPEKTVQAMNDRMEPYSGEKVLTDY